MPSGRRGSLERWDERNQRILERQEAKRPTAAEEPTTIWVTDPSGQRYRVVIDRSGYPFRTRDWWLYVAELGFLAAALVEPIYWLRHRVQFGRGWSVGVLRGAPGLVRPARPPRTSRLEAECRRPAAQTSGDHRRGGQMAICR